MTEKSEIVHFGFDILISSFIEHLSKTQLIMQSPGYIKTSPNLVPKFMCQGGLQPVNPLMLTPGSYL